jgi:hypothetical protein
MSVGAPTRSTTTGASKGLPDDAVCTLTELLGDIVVLIHDEVLVEDLEDLATLQISHGAGVRRGEEGRREERREKE